MAELWSGVARIYNAEERQEASRRYQEEYNNEAAKETSYYSGTMGERQEPEQITVKAELAPSNQMIGGMSADLQDEPEPQPSTHWIAQPENFMEVWSKYDQDPDYEDEHYSRAQIDMLYNVYSHNNPDTTPDRWKPLMDNDPYLVGEIEKNQWYDPNREAAKTTQQTTQNTDIYKPTDPNKQGWVRASEREVGDWNNLDTVAQIITALSSSDKDLANQPGYVKYTQAGSQAFNSALALPAALKIGGSIAASIGGGGAVAAALTNPYVLAAAGIGMAGLTFYEAVSGKEMPVFDKFREISDIADTTVEHVIGFGTQTYNIAKEKFTEAFTDPNDAYGLMNAISDSVHQVIDQAGSMWRAGEYTYEMYGDIGDFAIDALKKIFEGEEGTKEGEAWLFNLGINEKQQMEEGTYRGEGMKQLREIIQEMDEAGYDKDVQNSILNYYVNRASGSTGYVSDYAAQMLLDADILLTPMENTAAKTVMKVTGNDLGVQAANANSGNILTQLPVVGPMIQASGQKAPGGINEFIDQYKNLARTQDVSTLSAADRFFGGINEDGTIKEFARTERTGLADMVPESKVAGVGNIANDVMNAYMHDVQDTADIRNRLASLRGEADPNVEYQSGLNNSAEVLTVRDGIRHAIDETNPEIILKQFENSAGARDTLQKTADALGMEVKDVLSLYSETPAVFEQRVRDYAAQNNNMIAGIDVTNGVDPISTIVKGFTTSKDGKGTPLDWNIKQVQYKITTSMIDSMAKYYTDYYGVKPNSTVNTVFDTMKSAQSLLLLGWSPSYFINNVINNAVTSAAEGVLGFMTPKQIQQYMDAFGVKPARMDVDVNAEFRGQEAEGDAFSRAVSQAKKEGTDKGLQGALTGINGLLKKANNKLGVFSNLSGIMETLQGNQLTAVSIQQYWRQRWKRGEGFHLMPNALVQAIEAQNPGLTNVIYQAIENGLNMDQVKKVLFDTYGKPDAGTVMKDICADLFRGEANVYEEILEKSGVMSEIRERFANCKTDEERRAVMESVQQKLNDYIENLRREDLIQRANNVATVAESEGLAPVAQIMSEMEMNHTEFWIRQRNEWTQAYTKIMEDGLDGPASRSLLADLVARQDKEWADLYKQEVSTSAGVMKGLGFQNESHARYIGFMNEKNQNWQDFNAAKSRELARAYERTNAIVAATDKGKKVDRVKVNEVWEDFHRNVSELYDQHFAREQEMQSRMDAAFVEGYEFATQRSGEQLRQNFNRIREIRQRMHDMQQDAHDQTSKMTREDKAKFYEEFNPKYNALIREIGNLGDANAQIIDNTTVNTERAYENHAPVNMTPEQTVQATEIKDTSDAIREQAMRERKGYLDREGIREGWIESGRTPAEADLMMAVYDAAAESWAKMNGAYVDEFYSQAAQLKGIAQWLPGTADASVLNQTTAEYIEFYYPYVLKHYGNPNFREWFGIVDGHPELMSKVVDDYGMPLVVHHGTNKQFTEFNKNFRGTNTISKSAKLGFFFTDSEYVAETYVSESSAIFLGYAETEMIREDYFNRLDKKETHVYSEDERQQILNSYSKIYNLLTDEYDLNIESLRTDSDDFGVYSNYFWHPDNYLQPSIDTNIIAASLDGLQNVLNHIDDIHDGEILDTYLYIQNPFIYDFGGKIWNDELYVRIIEQAQAEGHDGVIFRNVVDQAGKVGEIDLFARRGTASNVYCVFEPTQIKSIENRGTFSKLDPNILHQQAQEIVKGSFEHSDIGNIIRMLNASDITTMVHESGHMFRRTLSTPLMQEFTTWAGFESVGEFQELETRFWKNDPTLTDAEKARYQDAEEKFARGFEQYLMDGSAPTAGLKAVFKSFRDYLLDIYKKVKTTVTGNDYSGQGEFVFHGQTGDEVLNINAEINGVKLRDVFDRMLTDDVQRIPGYTELVQNLRDQLANDRHNMRMKPESLSRRAQVEVTRTILQSFGSMEEAEQALVNYDLPMEINGWRVDDGTLFEAINAAKNDPQMNPFSDTERHEVTGTNSYAYSIVHANEGKKYQVRYKVVELNDLVPSNEWFGDQLIINENYPADAQARNRSADQSDVYAHAAALNPGMLIDEQRAIDSGTPIVGEGNMFVESGNGRVLSLQYAQQHFPEQWNNYQEYLRNSISDYGINPAQLDSFENPVLIRERLGGDSIEFAEDANSNRNKAMSASENALTDANKVNMVTLGNLDITPGEGIDTFTTEKNALPAVEWLRSLPEMERARYSTMNRNGDLILSADGKTRFTNALFATLYATPESMEIIKSFSETADSNIQAVESALKATLPEMARAEGLIQSGSRAENLSITADVMAAAGLLQEARKAGINIHDYLAQQTIPGFERWTPTQALLAGFFGDAKNNVRMLKDFFNAYGEEVYKSGDPNQLSLFGESKTREQMINDSLEAALNRRQQNTEQATGTQQGPALNQTVMDSDGRWTSEFAKILDENLQRTFDDGMAIPLDQAESVYLKGDVNVKYETNVQRWLRDFSNDKNLSADQYLYAWGYMEWWVQGSNGEAPKGNPIWEANIQKMVMQDFVNEHSEAIKELQRRYKKGAEVDQTAVPNQGEYFKRTYGFEHGFWNIAGNVYKDGKLIAYLPEELDKMQKTIEVDGQSYRVLGVDLNNPEGLVYYDPVLEIVRTVNAGKPEGFEEPRNPFAFIRPAKQGSTPQTMPIADAYGELKTKYLDPALSAFLNKYKEADTDAQTQRMSGLDVRTRAEILKWLDQDVAEDMRQEKYRAMKYSDMKKDAAMLNYNQRYGFDPILTMLSPYQFWYTRSMWKWAKRMIDKPALGNAYQRMQEYEDKNRQENLPSRLSGKWRIPMPFLPDWMGGSYYVDLNAQLFPFAQFGQSYGSNMNAATLNARTQEILEQQVQAGDITAEQMNDAISRKEGAVWENAYAEAETEIGTNDGLNTLASQFISPSIFISWYQDKMNGENPGTLSGTRTGRAIKALTQDIPLVSKLGEVVGDAMILPEKALRKLYGFDYTEFGEYGDQQIRKQISQMAADGELNWQQALNAMVEKSGTIWDMAADRQRKETEMKVPGFAGAEAAKAFATGNANLGETLGAMAMSLLGGGSIYPEGEKTLREMKALRDQAYIDEANGVEGAVSNWYDQYPEYAVRTATYIDDPEELLKYTLYNNISQIYYDQSYAQKQEIQNELGPEFAYALLNSDTKNYKAVPIEKLAEWNAALGGTNPNVGTIDVEGVRRVMQLNEHVIDSVDVYYAERDQRFPGVSTIENGYYALPKGGSQRKEYLSYFPQLKEYWNWKSDYKADHPEFVIWNDDRSNYFNEEMCYNSYAEMSERTQQDLEYAKVTKNDLGNAARYELTQLYQKYANPSFMSFDEYVKQLQDWK